MGGRAQPVGIPDGVLSGCLQSIELLPKPQGTMVSAGTHPLEGWAMLGRISESVTNPFGVSQRQGGLKIL